MSESFFAADNSIASCPAKRSSSAIRSSVPLALTSVSKISFACSSTDCFQGVTISGLRLCSRQIAAWLLSPRRAWRATSALKAGAKLRRVLDIGTPFWNDSLMRYSQERCCYPLCPVLGVHYNGGRTKPLPLPPNMIIGPIKFILDCVSDCIDLYLSPSPLPPETPPWILGYCLINCGNHTWRFRPCDTVTY